MNEEVVNRLVDAGFTRESAAAAVEAADLRLLEHTGSVKVLLGRQP